MRDAGGRRNLIVACTAALLAATGLLLSQISLAALVWSIVLAACLAWLIWLLLPQRPDEANAQPAIVPPPPEDALTFLSVVGHDLRQPMQAISLYAATLATHALPDSSRQLVTGLEAAAETLSLQFEEVMAIAKLESGRIVMDPKPVALGALLSAAVADHLADAHARGLHLRHVATQIRVWGDEAQLARALDRLVRHALRITESGGVLLGCRRRGADVVLEVRDTSGGMAREQQDLVFKPFSHYGQRMPDRALGLVLAQRIVQRLGGALDLRVREGRGNVFAIRFERYAGR